MASVSVTGVRRDFERRLVAGRELVTRLSGYRVAVGARVRPLSPAERASLAEMAFLRMLLSWEDFLEESFIRYMLGARPRRGPWPRPVSNPSSLEHARTLMLGEGRTYVDWYTPESVVARVQHHFRRGDVYTTPINAIAQHLQRMKIIRNKIAHRSQSARAKYESLLRDLYGSSAGQRNPGFILLGNPPGAALPPSGGATATTLFELYASLLDAAASRIVP